MVDFFRKIKRETDVMMRSDWMLIRVPHLIIASHHLIWLRRSPRMEPITLLAYCGFEWPALKSSRLAPVGFVAVVIDLSLTYSLVQS